ncbi:MAG TPA: hypothetical protein VIM42_08405 [Clostridium sp.]
MQLLEVKVTDLFARESYRLLNREDQWDKALKDGWKFTCLSGCFSMKVIKIERDS